MLSVIAIKSDDFFIFVDLCLYISNYMKGTRSAEIKYYGLSQKNGNLRKSLGYLFRACEGRNGLGMASRSPLHYGRTKNPEI